MEVNSVSHVCFPSSPGAERPLRCYIGYWHENTEHRGCGNIRVKIFTCVTKCTLPRGILPYMGYIGYHSGSLVSPPGQAPIFPPYDLVYFVLLLIDSRQLYILPLSLKITGAQLSKPRQLQKINKSNRLS